MINKLAAHVAALVSDPGRTREKDILCFGSYGWLGNLEGVLDIKHERNTADTPLGKGGFLRDFATVELT